MNEELSTTDAFPAYSAKWPAAPAGFADRVVAAVQAQHRTHRRRVWLARAGGLALAASVVAAVILGFNILKSPAPEIVEITPMPAPSPAPKAEKVEKVEPIQKPFAEAGEAIAAITRKTTDKALAPSKTMIASAERLPMPVGVEPMPPADTKSLTDATEGARVGLDPVSSQPRRAMNRMLRDFGIAPSKPRS